MTELSQPRFLQPCSLPRRIWTPFFFGNLRKAGRALAKKIVPKSLVQEVQRFRNLKKAERPLYIKLRIANKFARDSRKVPPGALSFVFVCFGNIMRSPMCEA